MKKRERGENREKSQNRHVYVRAGVAAVFSYAVGPGREIRQCCGPPALPLTTAAAHNGFISAALETPLQHQRPGEGGGESTSRHFSILWQLWCTIEE